jgi:Family of unknown function (DUF6510)
MTDDAHLDGNALGALFHDVFGREMTDERACCATCGSVGPLGTLIAYRQAPGDVLRCSTCGAVVLVAVSSPSGLRLTFESIRWMELSTGSLTED